MSTIFYTASSLDGFIATEDHSLEWLFEQDFRDDGPMNYRAFEADIGALVMGASTYLWLRAHDEHWRYTQPTWIFTHRDLEIPEGANVRLVHGEVGDLHPEIVESAMDKHVWVMGGGALAGQFAEAGVLDELWVQFAPVALGAGAPLMARALDLELLDFDRNGDFLCGRYRVRGVRESGSEALSERQDS